MSIIKRSILVFFVAIILLTSFIFPASAIDSHYTFNVPEPISSGYDGYVVVPMHCTNSYIPSFMIAWDITPVILNSDVISNDPDYIISSSDYSSVNVTVSSNKILLNFSPTNLADNTFYVSWYLIYNGDTAPTTFGSGVFNGSSSYEIEFSISQLTNTSYYPNAVLSRCNYFSGCHVTNFASGIANFTYTCIFGSDVSFYEKLTSINSNIVLAISKLDRIDSDLNSVLSHFVNLLAKVDYTNEQLDEIVLKFSELLEVSYSIQSSLDDFIYVYFDTFMYQTFPDNMNEIISRLDALLRQLNKQGDLEQTTVDTSNIDNYVDIEQSLVNNDEAESAINDFDVSISGKAYSFIWDLITRIFNSHSEVFGLVIAILTLGFIALLLNR